MSLQDHSDAGRADSCRRQSVKFVASYTHYWKKKNHVADVIAKAVGIQKDCPVFLVGGFALTLESMPVGLI